MMKTLIMKTSQTQKDHLKDVTMILQAELQHTVLTLKSMNN